MSIRYIQDEPSGTTVAILEGDSRGDAIRKIQKIIDSEPRFRGNMDACNSRYLMPATFKAVCRVHGTDVWDEVKGRELAREKLLNKYHDSMRRTIYKYLDDMLYVGDKFVKYLDM